MADAAVEVIVATRTSPPSDFPASSPAADSLVVVAFNPPPPDQPRTIAALVGEYERDRVVVRVLGRGERRKYQEKVVVFVVFVVFLFVLRSLLVVITVALVPRGRPAPVTVDAIAHLDVVVVAVGIVGEGGGEQCGVCVLC